jgi:hypothetical protein
MSERRRKNVPPRIFKHYFTAKNSLNANRRWWKKLKWGKQIDWLDHRN